MTPIFRSFSFTRSHTLFPFLCLRYRITTQLCTPTLPGENMLNNNEARKKESHNEMSIA